MSHVTIEGGSDGEPKMSLRVLIALATLGDIWSSGADTTGLQHRALFSEVKVTERVATHRWSMATKKSDNRRCSCSDFCSPFPPHQQP